MSVIILNINIEMIDASEYGTGPHVIAVIDCPSLIDVEQ